MSHGFSFTGMSSPSIVNPSQTFGAKLADLNVDIFGSSIGTANEAPTPVIVTSTAPVLATVNPSKYLSVYPSAVPRPTLCAI